MLFKSINVFRNVYVSTIMQPMILILNADSTNDTIDAHDLNILEKVWHVPKSNFSNSLQYKIT